MQLVRSIVIACALAASSAALAQVAVMDPWVRGTVPAQKATGAFMQLKSATDARSSASRHRSPVSPRCTK